MSDRYEERVPEDLQPIAARLSEQRADVDDLQLDQMKQRVLARSGGRSRTWLGARLAAILTSLMLALGAGGAVALSGIDSHSNTYGGASAAMYKKHKHHCTKNGKPHPCPKKKHHKHSLKGTHTKKHHYFKNDKVGDGNKGKKDKGGK